MAEKSILITVSDSGRGIHADLISTLGELGQTYGKKGGSGLGLYHARTTAEAWGGTLLIQSSRAGGTSITLDLPLYSTEQKKFEALASG
jgi:signal transduction histidine kinase